MKRGLFRLSAAFVLVGVWSIGVVMAQDFQRTYRLGAGGSINIRNVSGDIIVSGYDGDAVIVRGIKEGPDRDQVDVEDTSSGNRIDLRASYPNCRNCSVNASVRFQVQVPRSTRYRIGELSTASGDIEVTRVTGDVHVNTASGDVSVRDVTGAVNASTASGSVRIGEIAGTVNASTASGNVEVDINRLEGTEDMKFSSASGDVRVRMPSNLDAEVEMSTVSGSVRTNFPLEVRKDPHGAGERASGRLGSGSRQLRITSASGDISLLND